jgi:hypothetical protein
VTPLLLDLFCGKGGWSKAALSAGWRTVGVDNQRHDYPGELILCNLPWPAHAITSLHPTLIIASPPCEEFARAHLPWLRGNGIADCHLLDWSLSLIGRMPCPVIVECSWFAARHRPGARLVGSYALWGNVPALMPKIARRKMKTSGTRPADRAMIPYQLAEWIISTAPLPQKCE